MVDINDDGIIDADEYRFSCITKYPIDDVDVVDDAFKSLLNVNFGLRVIEKANLPMLSNKFYTPTKPMYLHGA